MTRGKEGGKQELYGVPGTPVVVGWVVLQGSFHNKKSSGWKARKPSSFWRISLSPHLPFKRSTKRCFAGDGHGPRLTLNGVGQQKEGVGDAVVEAR
jgi:hypothetical protein